MELLRHHFRAARFKDASGWTGLVTMYFKGTHNQFPISSLGRGELGIDGGRQRRGITDTPAGIEAAS